MAIMVNDCYTAADQKVFHEGIMKLNDECKKMHDVAFMMMLDDHGADSGTTTLPSRRATPATPCATAKRGR